MNAVSTTASGTQTDFNSLWVGHLNQASTMLQKADPYKCKWPKFS
jgi:hypothetical protein